MKHFPRYLTAILCLLLISGSGGLGRADGTEFTYLIRSLSLEQDPESKELRMLISGDGTPVFTSYRLFDPPRLVIDIADADFSAQPTLPANLPLGAIQEVRTSLLDQHQPRIVRLELLLDSADGVEYQAKTSDQGIVLSLNALPASAQSAKQVKEIAPAQAKKATRAYTKGKTPVTSLLADLTRHQPPAGVIEAIMPRIPSLEFHLQPRPTAVSRQAGESKAAKSKIMMGEEPSPVTPAESDLPAGVVDQEPEEISVEFFKTDLHNVFRFFGEITKRNIVIAEGVQGTLTLTLQKVPWDFALDIVLNLKNLQKEERHNTIVISPKDKAFEWPQRATDKISIRADAAPGRSDSATAQPRGGISKEQVAAKELIDEGSQAEQRGAYQEALAVYQKALELWPENNVLARRIALLNLRHLGNNARALHFARSALRHEANDDRSALIGAVAAANMQRMEEAKALFDEAIGLPQPLPEALVSYAAFAEEHDSPHGALALLERYHQLFGEDLETMISEARLLERAGAEIKALREYRAILYSGHQLPADLQQFIEAKIAAEAQGN